VKRIDSAALIRAIEELYRTSWCASSRRSAGLSPRQIDTFRISRTIADATAYFEEHDAARVRGTLA